MGKGGSSLRSAPPSVTWRPAVHACGGCQSRLIFEARHGRSRRSPRSSPSRSSRSAHRAGRAGPAERLVGPGPAESTLARGKKTVLLPPRQTTTPWRSSTREEIAPAARARLLGAAHRLPAASASARDRFPTEASVLPLTREAAWNYSYWGKEHKSEGAPTSTGHSLGGAIRDRARAGGIRKAAGLVVESSFTSITDMARLEEALRAACRSICSSASASTRCARSASSGCRCSSLHGTADEVVPFAMGERLFAASRGSARPGPPSRGGPPRTTDAAGEARHFAALLARFFRRPNPRSPALVP